LSTLNKILNTHVQYLWAFLFFFLNKVALMVIRSGFI